jgi:hypothetical protein
MIAMIIIAVFSLVDAQTVLCHIKLDALTLPRQRSVDKTRPAGSSTPPHYRNIEANTVPPQRPGNNSCIHSSACLTMRV